MNIAAFEVLMQLLRDRAAFLTEIEQQKNLYQINKCLRQIEHQE